MHATTGVNLENMLLSERSWSQKATLYDSIQVDKSQKKKADLWLPGAGGKDGQVVIAQWVLGSFSSDENVLERDIVTVVQHC